MVGHAFNPRTREAKVGGFLSSRPAWSTKWVPVQPGLYRETLSWKTKKKERDRQTDTDRQTGRQWWYTPLIPTLSRRARGSLEARLVSRGKEKKEGGTKRKGDLLFHNSLLLPLVRKILHKLKCLFLLHELLRFVCGLVYLVFICAFAH